MVIQINSACNSNRMSHPVKLKGFQETVNQREHNANRTMGARMIIGASTMDNVLVLRSSPINTSQHKRKVYSTVKKETPAIVMNTAREILEGFTHSDVSIASFERNPEKNGIPASEAPLTKKQIKVTGNL